MSFIGPKEKQYESPIPISNKTSPKIYRIREGDVAGSKAYKKYKKTFRKGKRINTKKMAIEDDEHLVLKSWKVDYELHDKKYTPQVNRVLQYHQADGEEAEIVFVGGKFQFLFVLNHQY